MYWTWYAMSFDRSTRNSLNEIFHWIHTRMVLLIFHLVCLCVCVRFHTLDTFRFTHVALQPHNIKYALQCSVLVNWFVHTAPAHIHSYNYFLESIWINRSIDNFRCGQIRIHLWQGVHQQAFSPSSFSIVDFSRIVCFAFIVFFRFLLVLILLLWKLFKW